MPRYIELRVIEVIQETPDAKSFVLEIPPGEQDAFSYKAGQYCTFKVESDAGEHLRCYSMSSSPDADEPFRTTVKRVPDGIVSNWLNDSVQAGDVLAASPPAGVFCLADDDDLPLIAFAGGSGITPVASIVKTALRTTNRQIRLLFANRDADSVILGSELDELAASNADRFTLLHHHDELAGFLQPDTIGDFVGPDLAVSVYVCGPTPFMDLVEGELARLGHDPDLVRSERFVTPEPPSTETGESTDGATVASLTLSLSGTNQTIEQRPGETVLEAARRSGLQPPFSCQAGNCATCMAELAEGAVSMRVNDVLTADEVDQGWILTCQSEATTPTLSVIYPD